MKKNRLLIFITAAGAFLPLCADTLPVVWRVNPATGVQAPLMVDSTTVTGTKYDLSRLLDTPAPLRAHKQAVTAKSDTVLTLGNGVGALSVQTAVTRIRPDAYAKGTLKVSSPARFALYVDGKKEGISEKADGNVSAKLSMEPYSDHEVAVRVLNTGDTPSVKMEWIPDTGFETVRVTADASAKRRFSLDDTAFGTRITRESLSPDGNWLVTSYANQYDADKTLRHATLTDLRTGRTVTLPSSPAFAWMPSGASLYGAVKSESGHDIVVMNPATMEQKTVARDIPESSVVFNAKGDKFYYSVTDPHKEQKGPLRRQLTPGSRATGETDGSRIFECDTRTGAIRPLTWGGSAHIADVHPTEDKILILLQHETPTKRPFFSAEALEMDTRTLEVDTIVPETGFLTSVSYSPDAKKVLVLGSAAIYDGIGAKTGKEPMVNDFDMQVYELNLADRKVRPLSIDFDPSIKQAEWASDGKIYILAEEGFENNLYSLDPSTLRYTRIPLSIETLRGISVSRDGSRIAYWGQGADYAGSGYVYDTRKKKDKLVDDPLAERLAEIDMSKSEAWNWTDPADGTVIEGYITYPPEFDPDKKYPLIVYYYGGTSPTQKGISNPYTPQLFASRGYVVYTLNPSGTTGYGQEFSARHVNAWGKRTADDIIQATKSLVATHPFVDGEKIGCLGASYGGFMTQYLQTLTPMFAAAVSHAGISDVTSYWGEGWWGHSYNGVAAADSYPWSNPELFTRQGSLFNADKIHTPLLLLHGTKDTNVPPGESQQIFNALRILDRPVEYIEVDGENHFISDYAKRRLWHSSIMAWFDLWLKDNPQWWSALWPDSPYAK